MRNASRRDIVHGGCFNLFNHFLFVRFAMMNLVDRVHAVVPMDIKNCQIETSITIDIYRGEDATYDYPGSDDMFELIEIQAVTIIGICGKTTERVGNESLFEILDDLVKTEFYNDEDTYIERVLGL